MNPSEALIAIIDDSKFVHDKLPEVAEAMGSRVVAQAQTLEEAETVIDGLGASRVNLVLMDENLTRDGYEGRGLIDKIRAEHPKVNVFSISMESSMGDDLGIPTIAEKGTDADSLRANIEAL